MVNNLIQEAQRDDWHGQIIPRIKSAELNWHSLNSIAKQIEMYKLTHPNWKIKIGAEIISVGRCNIQLIDGE